jgi:hypothetical protein
MISTWLPGQEATIDLVWTTMEFEIEIDSEKPVSALTFRLQNDGIDQGSLYVDDMGVAASTDISETERDITYVTQLDETDQLPASVQHHLLVAPYLHDQGPHRTIASTAVAGTVGEIAWCSGDSHFYGCTATGTPGTWVQMLLFTPGAHVPDATGTGDSVKDTLNTVISRLEALNLLASS